MNRSSRRRVFQSSLMISVKDPLSSTVLFSGWTIIPSSIFGDLLELDACSFTDYESLSVGCVAVGEYL